MARVVGGSTVDSCILRGSSLALLFGIVVVHSGRRPLAWKEIQRLWMSTKGWKGPILKEETLRDYALRIATRLSEHNLGRYWVYTSADVMWDPSR